MSFEFLQSLNDVVEELPLVLKLSLLHYEHLAPLNEAGDFVHIL
jgi:hypothetical protein